MSTISEEVSYINSFCGYCRFFGHCSSDNGVDYGDYACWEFVAEEFCADNGATG